MPGTASPSPAASTTITDSVVNLLQRFDEARSHYLPDPIQLLFIAEAPPAFRVNRLFYFTGLTEGDTLFLEMMKVLYPMESGFAGKSFEPGYSVKRIRQAKERFLRRFQADGYFLIDACEEPMPDGATVLTKTRRMQGRLPALQHRLKRLLPQRETPIILIGGVTYAVCGDPLRRNGWKILNRSMIRHPARGGQIHFRSRLRATIPVPS